MALRSKLGPMDAVAPTLRRRARGRRSALGGAALRRAGVVGLVAAVLGAAFLVVRESSVLRVRDVFVTGVSSGQEAKVRAALRAAAADMTTLHVREDELRAAVAPYASVADLRVDTELPGKLTIDVVERRPAAIVVAGGQRIAVDERGALLRGLRPAGALPVVRLDHMPVSGRVEDRSARAAIAILGGAPDELLERVERARSGPKGLQLELVRGPDLIFGSASRLRAKWAAAARVLADTGAQGAVYLDLRIPERTAAGGVGPIEPEETAVPVPVDPVGPPAADATDPQP